MNEPFSRIVILLPTWVGDAVMATPALRALRSRFPDAHIAWMGPPAARDVLAGLAWADELIDDPARQADRPSIRQAASQLRQGRFDLGVLLPNSFRSAIACRLGRVRRRLGYDRDGRGLLLNHKLAPPRGAEGDFTPAPAISYYLELARALGCATDDRRMELVVEPPFGAEADRLMAHAGVHADRPVVLINPGASFGSSKLWPVERFAAVADALHQRIGAAIVINSGPNEAATAAAMEDMMRRPPAVNMARHRPTLGLLKALTARASLVITGDTGPRHIAASLGAPVVTIFGSTDPAWTTIDYDRERIIRVDVDCGPCQEKLCRLKGPEHHQCMRRIHPDMVLAAADALLSRQAEAP